MPAVSNNLTALAGLLSGPLSLRMPAPNVTVVENPRDSSTVLDPLRQAAAEATDTLLVYYAGHSLIESHDALALAMPHTQPDRVETSLNYDWLREILLDHSRAQRHVVLLDCCYVCVRRSRCSARSGVRLGEDVADRLDAEQVLVLVDVGDLHRSGRSSSAAKNAEAVFRIAFARRSSFTSRSSSAIRAASALVVPATMPSSVSARLPPPAGPRGAHRPGR
ncbi:caspase family protein [Streptomyces sp. NBC_01724]|uniref:hypothetical protein n=1 Tax=Streptomyces sp. NBC_01724 TaxID=2975922 RepID=UPI002E315C77|nr:hypothetical protein [Streptomyces sp. NBC_01724]